MLTCLLRLDRNDFSLRFSLVDEKPTYYHVTNHLTTYHMTHLRRLQTTSLPGIDNNGYTTRNEIREDILK